MNRFRQSLILLLVTAAPALGQGGFSGTGTVSGSGTIRIFPPPTLTVLPSILAFGNVQQGTSSASQPVVVQNTGVSGLGIVSIVTSSQYSNSTNCPATLGAGLSCTINVTFSPTSIGSIPGTLTLTDNAASSPQVVTLTGTGTSGVPTVSLTPASLSFGSIIQGSSSSSQPATLQNTGGAALTISAISATAQYTQTNNCPASLAPTTSCTINVTFSPTSLGVVNGTLSVTDNAAGSPQTVALTGTGIASGGGGSLALGWSQLPNTTLAAVCPAASGPSGDTKCQNVIAAWSGGWMDTTRHRMMLWGGGHTDYSGNEVYALDLTSKVLSRLNNPSASTNNVCNGGTTPGSGEQNPDGTANTRHTYSAMDYMANVDRMVVFGGSLACAAGNSGLGTWAFNVANAATPPTAWEYKVPVNGGAGNQPAPAANFQGFGDVMVYDPGRQVAFLTDNSSLFTYTYGTNTYTRMGGYSQDFHLNGVIDPVRKIFVTFGNGEAHKINIAAGSTFTGPTDGEKDLTATGCGLMKSAPYPGLAYDPIQNLIVGWAGGNSVFLYNPDTDSCSTVTFANGPATQAGNGTHGRFRYDPVNNAFYVVNDWQQNFFQLVLTNAATDFAGRCTAAGVVFCQGFDDSTGFQQNVNIFANATYPGVFPAQDATTGRSGTSMRIDIPPFQGANMGKFDSAFAGFTGANGEDIYFQVATRISPEMISNFHNFNWPTWKNHGFFHGNTSCTGLMEVTGLHDGGDLPVGTAGGCSSNGLYTNGGVPPYLLQQGDFNCAYPGNAGPPTCWVWPTNTWITIYYHIKLGTLDGNGNFPGTRVEAWEATNGGPFKKWIDLTNFNFVGDGPSAPFNHLELYPFMTGKDSSQGGYPTAHVWWDELIVSKQPIAVPKVPPALP